MEQENEPGTTASASARPSAKRPRANAAGSTAKVRAEVLTALGVLKVVTADQLWRLLRPEAKENKFARAALVDLQSAKLVHSEGRTSAGHKTWGLTTQGRDAAQQVMPAGREVGNIARGAGRSGAPHAMKELHAAWNASQNAAQRPAPLAPTPRPAPRGGTRSPAARTHSSRCSPTWKPNAPDSPRPAPRPCPRLSRPRRAGR